jgi:hypothetical protein
MSRRIVVREFIEPRGPLTHRECTLPKDVLEYILGFDLEEECTVYFMDPEMYRMVLHLIPESRGNLRLVRSNESKSKSATS